MLVFVCNVWRITALGVSKGVEVKDKLIKTLNKKRNFVLHLQSNPLFVCTANIFFVNPGQKVSSQKVSSHKVSKSDSMCGYHFLYTCSNA